MNGSGRNPSPVEWKPGDPCAACGSTNTTWNPIEGGCCGGCKKTDGDDD